MKKTFKSICQKKFDLQAINILTLPSCTPPALELLTTYMNPNDRSKYRRTCFSIALFSPNPGVSTMTIPS